MSNISELDLDLEKLFQPAWAQEKPAGNRFEKFTGDEGEKPRRGKRRSDFPESRGEARPAGRPGKKFGGGKKDFRRGDNRSEHRERPEPPAPLPEISAAFLPDEKGVEHIARQIKMTGRAYPLFQIAQLVLEKPERYAVQLAVRKKSDGAVAQPLFICALDETPWLSEDEAVAHVLKNHFATFYQAERTAIEPPKGTYTFVAQCGMSGVILGPPNYHDYQNQLRKLHAERFSKMPFDVFKSRVKIVKDEAVVKKWVEEQSFKTEYACLNVPEPLKLATLEELEKHFRATHKDAIIKQAETLVVDGVKSRNLRSDGLYRVVRAEWEQQRRFPLQLSTELSRQFAGHGLQFFKVNKTVVHVSVARPQFLDLETTPVSENVRRIVEFINAKPKCTRRKLIETLAPSPTTIEVKPEGQTAEPTPEQTALIADLHWLIHQGAVLEFADGRMETAKKPLPRPPKPEKKPAEEKSLAEGEVAAEVQMPDEAVAEPLAEADKLTAQVDAPVETSAPVSEPAQTEIAPAEAPPAEVPPAAAASTEAAAPTESPS
ncbi:MAG TPA: hypothetical protein VMD27_06085 [Candidatus Aquilonibacter sp.]|nr:hypothetical protein [Candidatus Aquilonibacter sp.]